MAVILASQSPRRRELMERIAPGFRAESPEADERVEGEVTPAQAACEVARRKAAAVAAGAEDVVIGADTIVVCDGKRLGKPVDGEDAFRTLRMLSGRMHSVITGLCVRQGRRERVCYQETRVWFYPLSEEEIRAYIATGEPMDKAGSYGIQGLGGLLVERIEGDYYNVVGLPAAKLLRILREEFGVLTEF
ncbi:MAG: Maf family protein [Eubacteriales bacterium]|jgi:septum formation protein